MRLALALALLMALLGAAGAATSTYRLKPGDTVAVSVWQDSKLDRQVVVGPDGMISFPLVGHLRAGGLTLPAVEEALKTKLGKSYKSDLDVTVTLVTLATVTTKEVPLTFSITGEVAKPGVYPLDPPRTNAVDAIAQSGGFGQFAAKRRVLIYRRINGEEARLRFNYLDFESGRDLSGNIYLRPGDVVVVPEKNLLGF